MTAHSLRPMDLVYLPTIANATLVLLLGLLLAHVIPFILDKGGLKPYPGPLFAKLSGWWLFWNTANGRVNRVIYDVHKAYGPFVRIAPNHVSIADPAALQLIYGSTNTLKADFYDAFATFGSRSIFSTRSRKVHARKRKVLAHTLAAKSVPQFEPIVRQYLAGTIKQWDRMCLAASGGKDGMIGDMAWASHDGRAVFNSLKWFNFLVFDIIGDLVFRAPFGMTERGSDMAPVAKRVDKAMASYDSGGTQLEYELVSTMDAVNSRGAFTVTLGMLPARWRSLVRKLPLSWVRVGSKGFENISAMAVAAVANRSQYSAPRNDILAKFFDATDEQGEKLANAEISSEAVSLLLAGTDTTSHSSAMIMLYLAQNSAVQTKLQAELDAALGSPQSIGDDRDEPMLASHEVVKSLPYLRDVINEGLRLFSTLGIGLPRLVQGDGLTVLGRTFAPGTVVSVSTYALHHDKTIWGDDAESFSPDRWEKGNREGLMKAFAPFSTGPRSCLGQNLAFMEMQIFVATIFHRYEVRTTYPETPLDIEDWIPRKPYATVVALKRRGPAK